MSSTLPSLVFLLLLATEEPALESLSFADTLHALAAWVATSEVHGSRPPSPKPGTENAHAAVISVITHMVEYVLNSVRAGGIQGLCIALLSALALTSSWCRAEIGRNAAVALRLAFYAGAWVDLDEARRAEQSACVSIRLSLPGNGVTGCGDGKETTPAEDALKSSLRGAMDGLPETMQALGLEVRHGLLAEYTSSPQGITTDTPLDDPGLDSLVMIQLQSELERQFGAKPEVTELSGCTVSEACSLLMRMPDDYKIRTVQPPAQLSPSQTSHLGQLAVDFARFNKKTDSILHETGFAGFFAGVYDKQQSLVIAYILEAFEALGLPREAQKRAGPPAGSCLTKYERLVNRYYQILSASTRNKYGRSADLQAQILAEYPEYQPELSAGRRAALGEHAARGWVSRDHMQQPHVSHKH
ncbi:uncharacterized protein PpBr36_10626 [Pyricularia pennisetigena]|uniref:uncharacterized protein n=1 Tax=Pyricularia pennisetigena TaxID=1578925 RepID=UPI00114D5512|nr:uncharacterized protein PpBr36_10626 [Pyricularia pennisetigena]TLS21234.1 hypothetical protein PpBr36_10626 [Pyricularia pennisetigena]